ncbi:MAG TPA: preprotein translocase subunit SecE [Solirubrobacteraceae bacterium]|nr:preprotein translocase subunit SecE [Solirubrobacteraceae bacterium]
MARDRKRARQRRPRPVREPASGPPQSKPTDRRSASGDLPGALEHVGDVDEFDAALVRGAEGVPLEQQPSGNGSGDASTRERGGRTRRGSGSAEREEAFGEGVAAQEAPVTKPGQPLRVRAIAFLRASWAELQRVQWPDRRHVTQATTVVIGFLVVAGVYLGAADWVAQKIVNFIL